MSKEFNNNQGSVNFGATKNKLDAKTSATNWCKENVKNLHACFTDEEIELFWTNYEKSKGTTDAKKYRYILCLLYTGCRVLELQRVKLKDIHWNEDYFVYGENKRVIPIIPDIKPLMQEIAINSTDGIHFTEFPFNEFLSDNRLSSIINQVVKTLTDGKTSYSCKMTFIKKWKEQGLNECYLSKILGRSYFATGNDIQPKALVEEASNLKIRNAKPNQLQQDA